MQQQVKEYNTKGNNIMHAKDKERIDALEKRLEILEEKFQELIDNIRIFMVKDEDEEKEDRKT
jgi:hypothetical protein|tara:strand:- start:224 stop:412 length:189 start_codon:yes stop_codon:yes gene_type:complete